MNMNQKEGTMDMSQMWPQAQACPGSPCEIHFVAHPCHENRTLLSTYQRVGELATSSQLLPKGFHPRAYIIFEKSAGLHLCVRSGLVFSITI